MGTVRKLVFVAMLAVAPAGCGGIATDVELPTNSGTGSDEMKKSPCVCNEVDFNSNGFTWRQV